MAGSKEVEIKLRLHPEEVRHFMGLEFFAGVDPVEKHYHTVYFDDEKHHLLKQGIELRVRDDGERSLQALKTIDSVERANGRLRSRTATLRSISSKLPALRSC